MRYEPALLACILIGDEDRWVAQDALRLNDVDHALAVAALLLKRGGVDDILELDDDHDGHDDHLREADANDYERDVKRRVEAHHFLRDGRGGAPIVFDVVKDFDGDLSLIHI